MFAITSCCRFCSGLGVAGAFPLTFSYLSETCSRATRTRYTGLLHSFWPVGGIFTSLIAHLTMPTSGAEIVEDNREHWSSWHRFLILSILPTIGCIIGLIWASESPRYLLEASREVEALAVYQRLHRLNKARTQYGLTELELPGRSAYRERPMSPSRNLFGHGLESVSTRATQRPYETRDFVAVSRSVPEDLLSDALPHHSASRSLAPDRRVHLHGHISFFDVHDQADQRSRILFR
jgi:MFS family permease